MLEKTATPLAQQVAAITAGMRAAADARAAEAGVMAALHALILATLARLFGRLEHMVELWQSGQLTFPAPARRESAHPQSAQAGSAAHPRRDPHVRATARPAPQSVQQPAPAPGQPAATCAWHSSRPARSRPIADLPVIPPPIRLPARPRHTLALSRAPCASFAL